MKFKGILGAQLSGALGGIVASHNRGGTYLRERATPVNPGTPFQEVVRAIMGSLAIAWRTTLTEAQRAAWDTYSVNVQLPNAIGDPVNVGGLSMYVRSNVPRMQAGFDRIDDAPTIFDLSELNPATGTSDIPNQEIDVAFDENDPWVNDDEGLLLVRISRPVSPTINFFKGPYRFAGAVEGDSVTPPTSPAAITAPFPFVAGQKLFLELRSSMGDGRLSPPFRFPVVAA